ncbi:MAG: sodium:alanine symporter family protein [Lachnospira sp.]|nr:sodium:alanine symporter family protein [Lachnospira sp.]
MLDNFSKLLNTIDSLVWGVPLIVLILAVGLFMTLRLKGLQITKLGIAFRSIFKKDSGDGEVSGFASLCTALSATIGTGNIVGVATALVAGGPGAMFWMWVAAIVGTATKYAECLLAVKFRVTDDDGHVVGGPFYYIEKGMGKKYTWLAKLFATFGVGAGLLGIGTFTQINGITSAISNFFDNASSKTINIFGMEYTYTIVISSIILTICVALVIIGGIKRISNVAQVVVPFMAATYVLTVLTILFTNATKIPEAFVTIVESAFGLRAVAGGALGSMMVAMQMGVASGIFSNEAGLGSDLLRELPQELLESVERPYTLRSFHDEGGGVRQTRSQAGHRRPCRR